MSSTCSVLPRDLVSVEVAAEQVAPPSDLVDQAHDSGALTDACTRKGPQMANPRPTPKPENLRPPWPPGTRGNPAGYSRGRRISNAIEGAESGTERKAGHRAESGTGPERNAGRLNWAAPPTSVSRFPSCPAFRPQSRFPQSRFPPSSQTLSASPTGLRARWACGLMVLGTTKCWHETWDGRFSSASRSPWSLRRAKWPSARIGLPMATSLSYPSDSIASHDLVQPRFSLRDALRS